MLHGPPPPLANMIIIIIIIIISALAGGYYPDSAAAAIGLRPLCQVDVPPRPQSVHQFLLQRNMKNFKSMVLVAWKTRGKEGEGEGVGSNKSRFPSNAHPPTPHSPVDSVGGRALAACVSLARR